MENYLSIGEVAKLKNVDVQSLRYYEKLGILIPAYVNPENGYRYYTMDQLMILDSIILCIDLGIPLKQLEDYVDESGELEFERLLKDGKKLANEKMERINAELDSIDRTLKQINSQKSFQGRKGNYTRYIFERYIITVPCEKNIDEKTYEKNLSRLLKMAKEKGLHAAFPHGVIYTYKGNEFTDSEMFLGVTKKDTKNVKVLPEGNYRCYQEQRNVHSDPNEIFSKDLFSKERTYVIFSNMSSNTYKYGKAIIEMQILTN